MAKKGSFTDILKERRIKGDIISFMSRYWNPKKSLDLGKVYSPQDIKDIVSNSLYINMLIESVRYLI